MPIVLESDSEDAKIVKSESRRIAEYLRTTAPAGVGWAVVVWKSPTSLVRPQVSLSSDHDRPTLERLFSAVVEGLRRG